MSGYTIKVNGKDFAITVCETTKGAPEKAIPAAQAVAAPAVTTQKAAPASVSGGKQVTAPMPGTVLKIKANGIPVKKGDAILVLEAMKMENEIAAPVDGTVAVTVSEGAKVNSGDVLAVIS